MHSPHFGDEVPAMATMRHARLLRDPRFGQILALSGLLTVGIAALGFGLDPLAPALIAATALAAQALCCWMARIPFDPLSPLITSLSLSLLLRTDALWVAALAAALAMTSKFALRLGGRHVFNPAALALVLTPLLVAPLGAAAWISPGQWGALGLFAVGLAGLGATVAGRAARLDTSLGFLGAWAALVFGRALWLGDPIAIPLHALQSGAVLVFAFFMISDPATTPPTRLGRLLHAAAVAALGFWLQTAWITNTGPILALVLLAAPTAMALALLSNRPSPQHRLLSWHSFSAVFRGAFHSSARRRSR